MKEHVAKEILMSERSYCEDLFFIIDKIQKPSMTLIEDIECHQIIFSNVSEIYQLHS